MSEKIGFAAAVTLHGDQWRSGIALRYRAEGKQEIARGISYRSAPHDSRQQDTIISRNTTLRKLMIDTDAAEGGNLSHKAKDE